MELWGEQIIIIVIFLIVPMLVGLGLPYFLLRKSLRTGQLPKWFSPINSVSAGLLLGVLLLHLVPDATGDTENAFIELGINTSYPVAMLLVGAGFFIVTIVEAIVSNFTTQENEHGHSHDNVDMFENRHSTSAIYTMVFGLSAHSIFEGLAIGLQSDSSKLWILASVVLIHKSLFSLVIGLAALRSLPSIRKSIIAMLIFSVSSPIGIAIGTIVFAFSNESPEMDLAVAILESIATGTFLFVVFIELIPKEMNLHAEGAIKQLIFVICGYALMAGMQALNAFSE